MSKNYLSEERYRSYTKITFSFDFTSSVKESRKQQWLIFFKKPEGWPLQSLSSNHMLTPMIAKSLIKPRNPLLKTLYDTSCKKHLKCNSVDVTNTAVCIIFPPQGNHLLEQGVWTSLFQLSSPYSLELASICNPSTAFSCFIQNKPQTPLLCKVF